MKLLIVAIAPGLALLLFFYLKDKYEKEPLKLLIKLFLLGSLVIFPTGFVETFLRNIGLDTDSPNLLSKFLAIFIGIALVEEMFKFIILIFFAYRDVNFNEPYDGIMYSVTVSLGFATLENILYVLKGGLSVGILRAFSAVPGHAIFAVFMGYYLGKAKFVKMKSQNKNRVTKYIFLSIFTATFVHALYDFLLLSKITLFILSVIPLLIICAFLTLKAMKIQSQASPFKNL